MENPFAPNETFVQIFVEETWLQGALLSNILYGVELTLFLICFTLLWRQINQFNKRRQLSLLAFITAIFILGTLFMGSGAKFTQLSFIENRNYPGGPGAYEQAMFSIPVDELGNAALVIGNFLMDALLVWRCFVIFSGTSRRLSWVIIALPCLLLMTSIVLGSLVLAQTTTSSPFNDVNFTLAYYSMTLALNVITTLFIVCRIILYRRRVQSVLGAHHVAHYTNVVAILVESASLFSAFLILFMVPFALNYPLAFVFIQGIGQMQTVSSLLIVFRVATGKAWTSDTTTQAATYPSPGMELGPVRLKDLSNMQFASGVTESVMDMENVKVNVSSTTTQTTSHMTEKSNV